MEDWVKRFIKYLEDKKGKFYEKIGCQRCGKTSAYKYEIHHIVYKSERGYHDEINNPRNLIKLCQNCHRYYHDKKDRREELIEERGLDDMFDL